MKYNTETLPKKTHVKQQILPVLKKDTTLVYFLNHAGKLMLNDRQSF
jgi:hypothetical protein